jgi:hypothetical protein
MLNTNKDKKQKIVAKTSNCVHNHKHFSMAMVEY